MIPSFQDVKHFRAPTTGKLIDIIVPLIMDAEYHALELIRFGAVYVDRVRETSPDAMVPSNAYVRIHTKPRRFPMASKVDWNQRVVHASNDFVLINKPGGVPVHASTDNMLETCVAEVGRLVGCSLHPLHRLDVPTHGLLALGKTPEFSAHFCAMMRQGQVRKEYLTLTYRAPPLGLMLHWMKPSERSPKVVEREAPEENWQECKLVVKAVHPLTETQLSESARQVIAAQKIQNSPVVGTTPGSVQTMPTESACTFEVRIELLTGRTHQIRAQLSKEGYHIVGDAMYPPHDPSAADASDGAAADESSHAKTLAREMEVEGTLALQAVRMRFPRMGAVPQGEGESAGRGGRKYVKLSKRQRREARVREAEESQLRPVQPPPGAAADLDACPPAASDGGGCAEAAGGSQLYGEDDMLSFELGCPWWRVTEAAAGR